MWWKIVYFSKLTQSHVTFSFSFHWKYQELSIHDVIGIDCCKWNVGLKLYVPFPKIGAATTHIYMLHASLSAAATPTCFTPQ